MRTEGDPGSAGDEVHEVAVVGAGLAGLACALDLIAAGKDVVLLEKSDAVGGRVRTDRVDGFLLDRGFQVILTAYPEVRRRVDLDDLALREFYPGALVRVGTAFHRIADPRRRPLDSLRGLPAPVGSLSDKLRVAKLRRELGEAVPARLLAAPAGTTEALLREARFSEEMLDRFFRPFFGGVLLDPELQVSARLFRYYFRMFAEGHSAVPATGMQALPERLARSLSPGTLHLGANVVDVAPGEVRLEGGERIRASAVVIASEGPEAARLLGGRIPDPGSRGVTCLYFDAPASPIGEPILVLNGNGTRDGPVNNLAVLSDVAPEYAPPGRSLVSVSVLASPPRATESLEVAVRAQLAGWFGREVESWRLLAGYEILHGQPLQTPEGMDPPQRPVALGDGLFVCGDHRENASLNGALLSGGRAATAVLERMATG